MSPDLDREQQLTLAEVADLLAVDLVEVNGWVDEGRLKVSGEVANGTVRVSRAALELFWAHPPRLRFSHAPLDLRGELARFVGDSQTRRENVNRLISLLTFTHSKTIEALWGLPESRIREWVERRSRLWGGKKADARDVPRELGILRGALKPLGAQRGLTLPPWMRSLLASAPSRGAAPRPADGFARTSLVRWTGHRWEAEITAALAQIEGTPQGSGGRRARLLQLAYHLAHHGEPTQTLAEALVDRVVLIKAFDELAAVARASRGSWHSSTEKHFLEVCRPLLVAGAAGGPLGEKSSRALAAALSQVWPYPTFEVPELVKKFKRWARAELRRAHIKPDPGQKVRAPSADEVQKRLGSLEVRVRRAIEKHEARGLSLEDYLRWEEWSAELRNILQAAVCAHFLAVDGLRGGSLHGIQTSGIHVDDSYAGAVRIERVIVKRVAREGVEGVTTSHGNEPYDFRVAAGVECSTWMCLPLFEFDYPLRKVLEWYQHSCGQCGGPRNGCSASSIPVERWVELRQERGWLYHEDAQGHVRERGSRVSKDGEWLSKLRAPEGAVVRYNPLWWTRDGSKPLLQEGLVDALTPFFGGHLHRWRHHSLFELTAFYPIEIDEAARLIHMDPDTARRIYNNPTSQQVLDRMRRRAARTAPDALEQELATARREVATRGERIRELEHWLGFLETVFGALPQPPAQTPRVLPPVSALQPRQQRRSRRSPQGGDAFAA